MEAWLISIYVSHHYLIYFVIMTIGFFEGPFLSMLCGVILAAGYLFFWPTYLALMAGDLLGDILWYFIGFRYGEKFVKKFGKYFEITDEHITKIKNVFHKRKYPILLFSKTTNGLGFALAILFTAGMSKIPFPKYMATNVIGQFIWSGSLIAIGFFFGDLYLKINSLGGRIIIVLLFALVVFLASRLIKYAKNKAGNLK